MIIEVLLIMGVGVLGYYLGKKEINNKISKVNEAFYIPDYKQLPNRYEDLMEFLKELGLPEMGNVADVIFHFGYNEGWNDKEQAEQEDVDKMMNELAEEYEKEHFSGNIKLSGGTH